MLLFFIIGCKDEPTPPQEKPEGYQQDVTWPSLAKSPWPMFHGNPQNTGRAKEPGTLSGEINWVYTDNGYGCNTGIATTEDSLLIIPFHYSLKAFTFDGSLKWSIPMPSESVTAPLIDRDGIIYCCYKDIIAVYPNGTIKWVYSTGNEIWPFSLNIGKDGTLFFVDDQPTLNAITSQGKLKWKITNASFSGRSSAFSPDGETLYIGGNNPTLIAIAVETGGTKWTFGEFKDTSGPLVDSEGNIYITTKDMSYSPVPGMYCLHPDKTIKWFYPHFQNFSLSANHSLPAMDINGNLYFAGDTLYSLNYKGELRWKNALDNYTVTPLICDSKGNVYVTLVEVGNEHEFVSYNSEGKIRFRIQNLPGWSTISSPGIAYENVFLPTQGKLLYSLK